MARRRRVSFPTMTDGVRTVSFFSKGKGIAAPKRKPKLCFSDGKVQFPLTIQGHKDWILHVKKERAKLKREIVKEVVNTIAGEYVCRLSDRDRTEFGRSAKMAIDLWEKRW